MQYSQGKLNIFFRQKLQISLFASEISWKMFYFKKWLKGDVWLYSICFFFCYQIQGKDQNQQGILIWYFLRLSYCPKTTNDPSGVRLLHWVKPSFNTLNTHTLYFSLTRPDRDRSCCCDSSLEHILCIHPPTENSPPVYPVFSLIWGTFAEKLQRPA